MFINSGAADGDVWVILSSSCWPEYLSVRVASSWTTELNGRRPLIVSFYCSFHWTKMFVCMGSSLRGSLLPSVDMSDPARQKTLSQLIWLQPYYYLFPDDHADIIKSLSAACCTSLCNSRAGAPLDCESEHVAVIAGTAAAILRSLFGQLHEAALTSQEEVDPDPLVCSTARLWLSHG